MEEYVQIAKFIAVAFAMAIGTFGPALGLGMIGSRVCENIGKYPESSSAIRTMAYVALGFVEALAIYILVVSLLILFAFK
ncbi:MAG: ATP synthase F0 subunit C [Candidatus Dependentiae bacterium]|nr:ATP synthase F0 subunit C [Candidatus Dependentiae bacterium]